MQNIKKLKCSFKDCTYQTHDNWMDIVRYNFIFKAVTLGLQRPQGPKWVSFNFSGEKHFFLFTFWLSCILISKVVWLLWASLVIKLVKLNNSIVLIKWDIRTMHIECNFNIASMLSWLTHLKLKSNCKLIMATYKIKENSLWY